MNPLCKLSLLVLLLPFSICAQVTGNVSEAEIQIGNGSAGGTPSTLEATTTTSGTEMQTMTTEQPVIQIGNVKIGFPENGSEPEAEDPVIVPPLGLGDSCEISASLCQMSLGQHCSSKTNTCECHPSHVLKSATNECLPLANKRGDPCNETTQCTPIIGGGSECFQGKCECLEGSSYWIESLHERSSGSCIKKGHVKIGDLCNETSDCNGHPNTVQCFFGRCSCRRVPVAYIVNRELTRCLPSVNNFGEECEESQQCHLGLGSHEYQCREEEVGRRRKVCQCKADAERVEGLKGCHKKLIELNDFCYTDMQCVAAFGPSRCFTDFLQHCFCYEGTTWNGARCVVNSN